MSTKKQLRERWRRGSGPQVRDALFKALIHDPSREHVRRIVAAFPLSEEIPSGLDLRGLHEIPFLNRLDLSDASLDYSSVFGSVIGCDLTRASLVEFDAHEHLQSNFASANLQRANLRNSQLRDANLAHANLTKAKLGGARLYDANLLGANLRGADLRLAVLAGANLKGADLADARIVDASLGGASWDEQTVLKGADLSGASLDDEFLAFARTAGATVGSSSYELAELDGTLVALEARNDDHRLDAVIGRIRELREQLSRNPDLDWSTLVAREFPPAIFHEVEDAVRESAWRPGDLP